MKISKSYFLILILLVCKIVSAEAADLSRNFSQDSNIKVMNNLVLELLNISTNSTKLSNFTNPYDGWVYFAVKSKPDSVINISIKSQSGTDTLISTYYNNGFAEAMHYFPKGKYSLKIHNGNRSVSFKLIVRAIPELIYSDFPENSHVTAYGPYDWSYLQKHIFKNINTMLLAPLQGPNLIASQDNIQASRPYLIEWKKQGKRVVTNGALPGVDAATLEKSYEYWNNLPGMRSELSDGLLIDEFPGASKDTNYLTWAKAVDSLYKDGANKDKYFYVYTYGEPMVKEKESKEFSDALLRHNGKILLEWYPAERPDEKGIKAVMDWYKLSIQDWTNVYPDAIRHLVINMNYYSSIGWNVNVSLNVDFKVHMDRYMNWMANDPVFNGLYGIAWYKNTYADEEYVRWASKLFRHYCIEGKKNLLSEEYGYKYNTYNISNPDFAEGTKSWDLLPASENSIEARKMEGFGNQEGRYVSDNKDGSGDTYLWIKKSALKPNKVSQIIKDLKPGRLYSIKMITADYTDMVNGASVRKINDISIQIDDTEIIKDKSFVQELRNYPGRQLKVFKEPAWMNYHLIIFKAKNTTAKLTISDWISDSNPGIWANQELMCNSIEIQPYFDE